MPAGIVKTKRDEKLWRKAKQIAAKAGRANDYAYITGIYKKMKGVKEAVLQGIDWIRERLCR